MATYGGLALRVYLDGVDEGSFTNQTVDLAERSYRLVVGGDHDGPGTLSGFVDEVAVYPHALGADQIRRHYEVGVGR